MPPNSEQPDPAPVNQPAASITPSDQPLPGPGPGSLGIPPTVAEKPDRPLKKLIIAGVVMAVLVVAGIVGAVVYQSSASTKKFNDLVKKITQQEKDGAVGYVKASAAINEFGQLLDVAMNDSGTAGTEKLTAKIDALKGYASKACQDKASDVTGDSIDKSVKGLKLSAVQKQYISDWKEVISQLEDSDYSNAGLCRDGQAIVSLANNFVKLLPGLNTLSQVETSTAPPSDAQINSLKTYTTLELTDKDSMSQTMPHTTAYLTDLKTLLADFYYQLAATKSGDAQTAQKYENDIETLLTSIGSSGSAVDDELTAFDKKATETTISASKAEIRGIEYQKSHGSSNPNMQLDAGLPAFRIVEATVTYYSDQHNDSFPHASNIDGLADIDATIKDLKSKGYLKDFSYTSSGADDSGFSLHAKMADGTVFDEKVEPSAQAI